MEQDHVLPARGWWQRTKLSLAMRLISNTDCVIADRPAMDAALAWCHDTLSYIDASGGLTTPIPQRLRAYRRVRNGVLSARGWMSAALRDPRHPFYAFLTLPTTQRKPKESAAS